MPVGVTPTSVLTCAISSSYILTIRIYFTGTPCSLIHLQTFEGTISYALQFILHLPAFLYELHRCTCGTCCPSASNMFCNIHNTISTPYSTPILPSSSNTPTRSRAFQFQLFPHLLLPCLLFVSCKPLFGTPSPKAALELSSFSSVS